MDSKPELWVTVNVHTDCTLNCPTMSVERKAFPLRKELSDGFISPALNMTFQTYCSKSENTDYNTDSATVFVFFRQHVLLAVSSPALTNQGERL